MISITMIITPNTQNNVVHWTIAFLMPLCFAFEFFMKSFFPLKLKLKLTREISTTTAQFMLRNIWPKNMRTKVVLTEESKTYKATKIRGVETRRPRPHITGSIQGSLFRSQQLRPLPRMRPQMPAALNIAPNINPTLQVIVN